MALQVIQKLATTTGHGEEAAAGMEVLAMDPQVLGQVTDPGGQQGDLDVAGAGVLLMGLIPSDDILFFGDFCHGFF